MQLLSSINRLILNNLDALRNHNYHIPKSNLLKIRTILAKYFNPRNFWSTFKTYLKTRYVYSLFYYLSPQNSHACQTINELKIYEGYLESNCRLLTMRGTGKVSGIALYE